VAAQYTGTVNFTVPAGAGSYAPETLSLCKSNAAAARDALIGVTALIEQGVATAVVELWLLKRGGDPTNSAHFFNTGSSVTASGSATWPLASWDGAQLRCKSGGTAGTLIASATAD
jgi:hypothetical protein